jgi:Iap family predicted aminopeptidase
MCFERVVLLWPVFPPSLVGAKSSIEAESTSEKIYLYEVQFLHLGIPSIDLDSGQQSQKQGCQLEAGGLAS